MSLNDAGVDLEIIFHAQYERIARVILGITKDPARAEELAVEVFLRSDRTPYARGEGVEAWLYRSAVRIGLSELRRGTLRGRCERIFGFLARGESVGSTPHEIYAVQEEARQVRLLLSVIEPRQAELLLLRSHDLSYQELAGALNLNPASVGTLLRRVLDAFRKEFINRYGKERYGHK
jgi:RNA polymerase sigma-70 factor (ECF subfamily)